MLPYECVTSYDVCLDEHTIASLRDYDPEIRARLPRAIHKEISDLIYGMGAFELLPLPSGRQAISSKLVLKVKYRAEDTLDKDKA